MALILDSFQISTMNLLGEEINLIWVLLGFISVFIIFFGGLVNYWATFLPKFVHDVFRYGKTHKSDNRNSLIQMIEIPKHYYSHYYIFTLLYGSILWFLAIGVYFLEVPAPQFVLSFLDFVGTVNRSESTSAEGAFIALTLLLVQAARRLYECLYVNVKSKARMNLLHHIAGFVHYFCVPTGMLLEAPGFQQEKRGFQWMHVQFMIQNITVTQWIAVAVFFWAGYHQFKAHKILSNLRKGKGSSSYSIPRGDWFEYVSCPHYTAEVILYGCFSVILGLKHQTGVLVFIWVLINQTIASLMSHFWYQDKFENYPKQRKSIIPFVF